MLRLPILVVLLTHGIPAFVTEASLADRLDKIYERLEKLAVSPVSKKNELSPRERLYAKLDRLNALSPEKVMSDDDEELVNVLQSWGLNGDQLDAVVKDLQKIKEEDDDKEIEYGDWNDEDPLEYPMDAKEWETNEDIDTSTPKPLLGVTPSALSKLNSSYRQVRVSAVDPIAATKERPKILNDTSLTARGRSQLRTEAMANIRRSFKTGKCKTPQARWLMVKQLAPSADTDYMPPYVQLHRCAEDTGCCIDVTEVCAPVEGKYVAIPFLYNKADGIFRAAKIQFFNHTQCECVSRETLQGMVTTRINSEETQEARRDLSSEGQNDWRVPTEDPKLDKEEESTSTPQLRSGCTCPTLFLATKGVDGSCLCLCGWPEGARRRDCLSLARGHEHFGLRDRVCVAHGACTSPACEHGPYNIGSGRCPSRRVRRLRYHARQMYLDKPIVV